MSRYVTFCSSRGLILHYSGRSSIFLFVYGLMLGWGMILQSHKKAKVFVIAPGSKHTVGRCWETILHPWCQNTSALPLPWLWSWTPPRRPLPTQQAVWWLSSRNRDYEMNALAASHSWHFLQGLWIGAVGLLHDDQVWNARNVRWEKIGCLWIITNRLLCPKTTVQE